MDSKELGIRNSVNDELDEKALELIEVKCSGKLTETRGQLAKALEPIDNSVEGKATALRPVQ